MSQRTFVILEAAACHDGDLSKASELVDLAASVGADAVKFQYCSRPQRLAQRRNAAEYATAYRLLAFPQHWFDYLSARARERGIEFMCTAYIPEDIAVVAPHVSRFKVASFESCDAHFVCLHAEFQKQVILSAGMGSNVWPVVRKYLNLCPGLKTDADDVVAVLHCVSAYPTPVEDANLAVLHKSFYMDDVYHGFSDHTRHPWTGALAVAAGAQIIEFHARLGGTSPQNADYVVARAPDEAAEYVAHVRLAGLMLGDGARRVMRSEREMTKYRVEVKS